MVPTIDISFIGIFLAVWGVLKTIGGWILSGINFISQKALAVLIGSKFWATMFFLGVYVAFARLMSYVITQLIGYFGSRIVGAANFGLISASLEMIGHIINLSRVGETIVFFFSLLVTFRVMEARFIWFGELWGRFMALLRSWKT